MDSFNANNYLIKFINLEFNKSYSENLIIIILVGLIIAIASATQDITVDALRIEQIGQYENKSMAAGAAIAVVGWWTGYKLGGVISLFAADYFENVGINKLLAIDFFILMAVIVVFMNIGLIFVKEYVIF